MFSASILPQPCNSTALPKIRSSLSDQELLCFILESTSRDAKHCVCLRGGQRLERLPEVLAVKERNKGVSSA